MSTVGFGLPPLRVGMQISKHLIRLITNIDVSKTSMYHLHPYLREEIWPTITLAKRFGMVIQPGGPTLSKLVRIVGSRRKDPHFEAKHEGGLYPAVDDPKDWMMMMVTVIFTQYKSIFKDFITSVYTCIAREHKCCNMFETSPKVTIKNRRDKIRNNSYYHLISLFIHFQLERSGDFIFLFIILS